VQLISILSVFAAHHSRSVPEPVRFFHHSLYPASSRPTENIRLICADVESGIRGSAAVQTRVFCQVAGCVWIAGIVAGDGRLQVAIQVGIVSR
jgi:hypothetical protein